MPYLLCPSEECTNCGQSDRRKSIEDLEGSTTTGRVGADEDRPRRTIIATRSKTIPQPKPIEPKQDQPDKLEQLMNAIPQMMDKADQSTSSKIFQSLR